MHARGNRGFTDQVIGQAAAEETLFAEDIAEAVYYCIMQPSGCDVVEMQIRPHGQPI